MEGYQRGEVKRRMRAKVQGIKSINVQNRQVEVKNSMGNGKAKELTCMTYGHELRGRGMLVEGWCMVEGIKGEKKMGQL